MTATPSPLTPDELQEVRACCCTIVAEPRLHGGNAVIVANWALKEIDRLAGGAPRAEPLPSEIAEIKKRQARITELERERRTPSPLTPDERESEIFAYLMRQYSDQLSMEEARTLTLALVTLTGTQTGLEALRALADSLTSNSGDEVGKQPIWGNR